MSMQIAEPLKSLAMPVEDLIRWERNPRIGDLDSIKDSLERFGQRVPVIYRTEMVDGEEKPVVYAGNHRLQAAYELGWEFIVAVPADDLTPDEVRAFALADNRTGDLGKYDDGLLAALLTSLPNNDGDLLAATGYDPQAISDIIGRVDAESSPFDNDDFQPPEDQPPMPGGDQKVCPHCGFEL